MTTTNTPFEKGLDEILKQCMQGSDFASTGEYFQEAKAALTQLHKAAIVAELEHITAEGDDAAIALYWYNDDEGHYHAIDIPTRIEQYKKEENRDE